MGLCQQCLTAVHKLQQWPNLPRSESRIAVNMPSYEHSARLECFICKKLYAWLKDADPEAYANWQKQTLELRYSGVMRTGVENQPKTLFPFVIKISLPTYKEDEGCLVELHFINSHAHQELPSRRSKSSEADLQTIKSWYSRCIHEHEECRNADSNWYPTRLLQLGSIGRYIRLVITKEQAPDGPYVTLSHRWNQHRYVKLQSSTISQLQHRIDTFSLPKSFQDAVRIARYLGLNYLWIDSLCIKQDPDDLSDWVEESKKMGQVYSNAALNVSATRSADGSGPLLGRSAWMTKIPTQTELQVDGEPQTCFIVDGDLWADEVDNGPLLDRGWVFQERFLAPRLIHFGETQLAWECCQSRALDMFPDKLPQSLGVPGQKELVLSQSKRTTLEETASAEDINVSFAERWQEKMGQYSKCGLTRGTDKLVALQGIVWHEMQYRPNDSYAAGMWKSSALYDLPWWRYEQDRNQFLLKDTIERAPSWSWASVDGEVVFPLTFGALSRVQDRYADVKKLNGHVFNLDGHAEKRGSMLIQGLPFPLRIQLANGEMSGFTVQEFSFVLGEGVRASSLYLEISTEAAVALSASKQLFILPLFATQHTLFGIVLCSTKQDRVHHRVGSVEIHIMISSSPSEKDKQNKQIWVDPQRSFAFTGIKDKAHMNMLDTWSKPAVQLVYFLRERKASSRIIAIV